MASQYGLDLRIGDFDWADPNNPFLTTHINNAFADAKLDPKKPWHWRLLLYCFAAAHYSTNKPTKWGYRAYCQLLQDANKIKSANSGESKDKHICCQLRKMARYKNFSIDHLRKMLRQARDPERNAYLDFSVRSIVEPVADVFSQRYGSKLTEQLLSVLRPLIIVEVRERIATGSRLQKQTKATK